MECRVRISFPFSSLAISLHNELEALVPKSPFATEIYIYIYSNFGEKLCDVYG